MSTSEKNAASIDVALLLLRVAVGGTLIAHGLQKLLVLTLPGVVKSFAGMGIPFAEVVAPTVAAIELGGGIALVLGVLTRLAGLLATGSMLGAVLTAHASDGFFDSDGGFEFPLLIAVTSTALAIAGPGRLSVHHAWLRGRVPVLA